MYIMTQKVLDYIEKQHMLAKGEKILVGLSGGMDSVALLHLLLGIREKYSLEILALHVNHGIREEAGEDEAFCAQLCEEMKVPFMCCRIEAGKLSQTLGAGLEEAARNARYEILEQYRQEYGCHKIAIAHHANDNAETMLFQLFRGSGLKGLSGIAAVRGCIIRPFLCVSREEISRYMRDHGLKHVEDASNQDMNYTRNQIRARVVPLAEEICEGAVEHMGNCVAQLRDIWEYLNGQATAFLEANAVFDEKGATIPLKKLRELPVALQREVLMESVGRVYGSRKDITFVHIENMRELSEKDGQKDYDLPHGLLARKSYLDFRIYKKNIQFSGDDERCKASQEMKKDLLLSGNDIGYAALPGVKKQPPGTEDSACEVPLEGEISLPDGSKVIFKTLSSDKMREKLNNIPQNDCTKWFDCDKINDHLLLRHRHPGDYLVVREDGASKCLQDYLVNEKVPREKREGMWLLADGAHILWVIGYRISMEYKVTPETKNILEVHLEEKTDGGKSGSADPRRPGQTENSGDC
ncbi:MAG: tRNA lysidine(34) synthetase TilS [Lachnospiraceae bacterium]|nr:tRNA lysidine(34) synthetase TilS [Lachnospiraceae bacterium]